jgi:hypothetical protein
MSPSTAPPFCSFTRTARMMPLMRPQTVTFWAITLPSIVEVTAGHLCRLARRLAGRCRHRGPLRTRQAAHQPPHWQARPRIDLRRGRLPRCPADLGVLVLRNAGWQRLFKLVFALSPAARICLSGMLIGIGGIAFYAWHVGESTAAVAAQSYAPMRHGPGRHGATILLRKPWLSPTRKGGERACHSYGR